MNRQMCLKSLAILSLATVLSVSAHAQTWWVKKYIFDAITLNGRRELGLHFHSVDGDRDTFNLLNYYGQGEKRFTDTGSVDIVGTNLFGVVNFRSTITDSRFRDPQQQRFSLDYTKGRVRANLGDIWGSLLNTNRYASLSRSMRGGQVQVNSGPLTVKVLRSEAKGSARTISIQGTNSSGPYYLQSNQLVADSEQVQVDGIDMVLGTDYLINYEVGYISFINRVIAPTSTIVVTYEAFGFNATPGVIQGAGARLNLGNKGQYGALGLTAMEQKVRGSGGLSTRLEQFEGFGAPSTPYFLQFEPIRTRPITIRVDGVLQVEGIDYRFDAVNPSIFYFNRFMPATSSIDVIYTPKPTQTVDGDRRVIGVDYSIPLGRYGTAIYSQATGELLSDVNPLKGTARGVSATARYRGIRLSGSVDDIPEDYVAVETRGFRRNERSTRLTLEGEGRFNYGASYQNSRIALRRVDNDGNISFSPARTTVAEANVGRSSIGNWSWSLEQKRYTSKSLTNESKLDSTSASMSSTNKRLSTNFGLERQSGFGTSAGSRTNIELNSLVAGASYLVGKGLSVSTRNTLSGIKANSDSGTGRDLSFALTYDPNPSTSIQASYADSDSGKIATLSQFQIGSGLGFDGNGFSGAGNPAFNTGGINQRVLRLFGRHRLNERVNLDARIIQSRAFGSVTSNSDTTIYGAGATIDFGDNTNLGVTLDRSTTRFLDTPIRSEVTSMDVFLDGSPEGRLSYRFGLNSSLNGGGSAFAQDSPYLSAGLTYRFAARQAVSLSVLGGRLTGYLPQDEAQASLTYQYQIYRNIALAASYRWRRLTNRDPASSFVGYRSNSFDLELTFDFGR